MTDRQAQQPSATFVHEIILGAEDFDQGLRAWPLWTRIGWNDIRQRYRRSVLGPFWITLSMGAFIALLGVIYSRLFGINIDTYLPYLAIGFIIWGFISSAIIESCNAFHENQRVIKQRRLPFSIYIFQIVWRNFIVLIHTIVLIIVIYVIFGLNPGLLFLISIPGMFLLYVNQIWLGMVLAILNTRFGDVMQIVTTVVQIMLFATPILWPASRMGKARIIADANPVYHFIQLVRAPLLGEQPEALSWIVVIAITVFGTLFSFWLVGRTSRRIVYWL